jgi:hypothetical protein|tara:strand:- start:843 stop:1040 length:198 start_codon:yes stop_codon:yes gene_type:complete
MTNLSTDCKQILEMLNGYEVQSLNYEGVVYIDKTRVLSEGEQVDTLNTNKKIKDLWKEYVFNEGF